MKSVSQERAQFAYRVIKEAINKGEINFTIKDFSSFVAGLPAMILQNGLGHTLCFLLAKACDQKSNKYKKEDKHWFAFNAMVEWLQKRELLPHDVSLNSHGVIDEIIKKKSLEMMVLQEEALRFLEWFKVMSKIFVEGKDADKQG